LTRPRAVVVVTGSELVRGERTDLNGPFLARQALSLGLEPGRIAIVGDRPAELEGALREGISADACLVSGGLGPTHDDRTLELLAKVAGVPLRTDPALEAEIEQVSRNIARRLNRPYADFRPGVTKQATIPAGAASIGLAGTAPGVVLETRGGCVAVALPGPPAELQRLWPNALATGPFRRLLARTRAPGRRVLRFFGVSESAIARALEDAGGDGDGLEATICARDFEIHVDLVVEPGSEALADELERNLVAPTEQYLYSRDERPVEEHVLGLLRARGWSFATAESCTGGMVAERVTGIAGASDVFVGAIVAYSNDVKRAELGVPAEVLDRHGAVSPEAAEAMAHGARERLAADVAVAVTGVAGPGGGTPDKPVGLVHLHAESPEDGVAQEFTLPGDRDTIRRRSTVMALHLVRRLLAQDRHEAV
jgi:nicotinamide-nucleotide amidase